MLPMTSFIVVAKEKKKREDYLNTFYKKENINAFDVTVITPENTVKQNTQSIGIEDIKHMQKKIFLKPLKSKTKAVVIDDAQLLTIEAQNALLKILEEPPEHTLLILSSQTKETLLPTILSRCQLIVLEEEAIKLSEKELTELTAFLENLPVLPIGEKLKKAEQLAKEKEKAVAWTGKLILVLRESLLENPSAETLEQIRKFQNLYTLLKTTNVNTRFAIENTLLMLTNDQ
jgi:DNA polymerase III subunit delta'